MFVKSTSSLCFLFTYFTCYCTVCHCLSDHKYTLACSVGIYWLLLIACSWFSCFQLLCLFD